MKKNINLVEINFDLSGKYFGSRLAANAIKVELENQKSKLYNSFNEITTLDSNLKNHSNLKNYSNLKNIEISLPFYKKNIPILQKKIKENNNTVIISGDHANSIFILNSLYKSYSEKKLGVIWIDAHADIHNAYSSPSGNVHGMSLGVFLNKDINGKNKLSKIEEKYWKELINLTDKNSEILKPENLIYLGLRSVEKEENKIIKDKNITSFNINDIKKEGINKICNKIIEKFKHLDLIYLSFDVDAIDSSISKGTGTPVAKGFNLIEIEELILTLIKKLPIKIFEITEINPLLDNNNKMVKSIIPILEKSLKLLHNK